MHLPGHPLLTLLSKMGERLQGLSMPGGRGLGTTYFYGDVGVGRHEWLCWLCSKDVREQEQRWLVGCMGSL